MHRSLLFLACGLLLVAAPPAFGDWDSTMPAKWVQMPDLQETGMDVNASMTPEDYNLADDFEGIQTGPITNIHVWGSWLNDQMPENDPNMVRFIMTIHADIPAAQNPDGYSIPGAPLWQRMFLPGEFIVRPYATDIAEGWFDPPQNYIPPPADTVCWQHNFDIPPLEAFVQQGTPEQPVVYWLAINAIPEDLAMQFGWKTSLDHWNDDGVFGFGPAPHPGPWRELIYPFGHPMETQSIDLAFVINGPDGPAYDLDYGDAPDPTYPTLLAAVEFDDTGSTRIGKYVFDHPFIIPGVLTITLSVILAFLIAPLVI